MIRTSIFFAVICSLTMECSRILDKYSHNGVYVSNYCPETKNCPEGSHIMCMFYVPGQKWGPQCSGKVYENMTITAEIAVVLLEKINAIRAVVALGNEVGKDNNHLPRAYGMHKLKWDPELATLAQVLANQCVLAHDRCRETRKFPDPGQTALRVRFSYPYWKPFRVPNVRKLYGPTKETLDYAVHSTVASWHKGKNLVDPDTILRSSTLEDLGPGFYYLQLINAPTTHMGCGIATYSTYEFFENTNDFTYNVINIFCNFSHKPHKGTPVYNTTKSDKTSPRCGCPQGTYEDDNCLCISDESQSCELMDKKDPALIILPIFTYEDAPSSELEEIIRNVNLSIITKPGIVRSRNPNSFENHRPDLHQKLLPEASWLFQKRPTKIEQSIQEHLEAPISYVKNNKFNRGYSFKHTIFSNPQFELPNRNIKKDNLKRDFNENFALNVDRRLLSDRQSNVPKPSIKCNKKFVETEDAYKTNHVAREKLISLIEDLEYESSHVHFHENQKKKLIEQLKRIYENLHTAKTYDTKAYDGRKLNTHNIENVFNSKRLNNEKLVTPDETERLLELNLLKGYPTLYPDNSNDKEVESIKREKELLLSLMQRNFYLQDNIYEDALSFEKRKYYQERLDSLQRKLAALEYYGRNQRSRNGE